MQLFFFVLSYVSYFAHMENLNIIEDAIEAIQRGGMVIVVDDENREN